MAQQQTQQTQQKDKAVLAYSGGLDTSVCIKWLQEEKNLDVIAVVGDVGQEHEGLEKIKQKALKTGAVECLVVDMRDVFAQDFLSKALAANALYENKYPLLSALSRPAISKHLVDAAHNPHGVEARTGAIEEAFGFQHLVAVLGVMADKDAEGILAGLEPVTDAVVCVPIDSPRAMDVEDLGEIAREVYGADRVVVSQQLGEGVERAVALSEGYDAPLTASGILIVGSVVLAAEARALFGRP